MEGAVQVWEQSNPWFQRYQHFCVSLFFWSDKHLQQCLSHLHHLQHLSLVKPPSVCHSPHITGMWLTRCMSLELFKCQLDTWFWLCNVKAEECLEYLLCMLGKEGYAAMDCWVPTDEADKCVPENFLNYLWKHLRWCYLSPSLSVWAWRCQEEVWQISW